MASNFLLYEVHQKLNEIFQCEGYVPFAGLALLIYSDFYQLSPVRRLSVYTSASSMKGYLSLDLCENFRIAELTDFIRKKRNNDFISLLNKNRKGEIDRNVEKASRFLTKMIYHTQHIVCIYLLKVILLENSKFTKSQKSID